MLSKIERVSLRSGVVIYGPGQRFTNVYFPVDVVLSVLSVMKSGESIEIVAIGNEGVSGAQMLFGGTSAPSQMICQVPGDALVMDVAHFTEFYESAASFRTAVHRYTEAAFNFMGQSIACNRVHSLRQRCAKWILLTHDRIAGDEFYLTHEFLAVMVGVRRAGVSEAASALQDAGLITYRRGNMRILNRLGLEAIACECYAINAAGFARAPM